MGINPMEKKKSLGSTPIGFNVNPTDYSFIRDINGNGGTKENGSVNENGTDKAVESLSKSQKSQTGEISSSSEEKEETSEKQVVSYYLEVTLVNRLKKIADQNGSYYSSLVSKAIRDWINNNAN